MSIFHRTGRRWSNSSQSLIEQVGGQIYIIPYRTGIFRTY